MSTQWMPGRCNATIEREGVTYYCDNLPGHPDDHLQFEGEPRVWTRLPPADIHTIARGIDLRAHARSDDPETSHAAAAIATDGIAWNMEAVYRVIQACGPMTDDRLCDVYRSIARLPPQVISGIRTRRRELVNFGYVYWTGHRADSNAGNESNLWDVHWAIDRTTPFAMLPGPKPRRTLSP